MKSILFSEKNSRYLWFVLFCFGLVLWHINHARLLKPNPFLYKKQFYFKQFSLAYKKQFYFKQFSLA